MLDPSSLRSYNVRGRYPNELDEDGAYLLGQAFAQVVGSKKVAVGRDARLSGPKLEHALMQGLVDAGVDVIALRMITTDTLYYVSGAQNLDGIQVSASHNPPEWNGMKFIKKGVVTLSDDELQQVYALAKKGEKVTAPSKGTIKQQVVLPDYVEFLLKFVDVPQIKGLRVVANPLNGTAGPLVEALAAKLPIELIPLNMKPDGRFPKGNPDPFLPEMRQETAAVVKKEKADLGASWDNDADRINFFDEKGDYARGVFTNSILAQHLLQQYPGAKIISECGIVFPIQDTVREAGGIHILNKRGQAFLKARMREEDALYCGENSGHMYFKDFWYADNGFIPLLLMLEFLSTSHKKLSDLLLPFRQRYFFTEEINYPLKSRDDLARIFAEAGKAYKDGEIDEIGGFSSTYPDWRFHLHPSDNEPLLRLLVEARNQELLDERTDELTEFVKNRI